MRLKIISHLALLVCTTFAKADDKAEGSKVYKQTVTSVVWIHARHNNGVATGSGTLIDHERKLVLTNYHVVQEASTVRVLFPVMRDGGPIAERSYYTDRLNRMAITGKVVGLDKSADLAIIRLESLPEKTDAVALAPTSPEPGDSVHSIGNAGKSGALFGYVRGTVRQVYNKDWQVELEPRKVAHFRAKVIETDSPTNPGDSGGPLLNDKGQIVGVTQGGVVNANSVSYFVDVSQVKKLLESKGVKEARATDKPDKPEKPTRREQPLTIADGGKLFSAEAVADANKAIVDLHKKEIDVLIVTYPVAPTDKLDELRKENPAKRTEFFKKLLKNRMERDRVSGVAVVICDDPKSLYVELSDDAVKQFPPKFWQKIQDTLVAALKNKKPDDGLTATLKLIAENRGKDK